MSKARKTGARKSELLSLRWQDLDFERDKIALFRSKVGNCDQLDMRGIEKLIDRRDP